MVQTSPFLEWFRFQMSSKIFVSGIQMFLSCDCSNHLKTTLVQFVCNCFKFRPKLLKQTINQSIASKIQMALPISDMKKSSIQIFPDFGCLITPVCEQQEILKINYGSVPNKISTKQIMSCCPGL